MNAALTLVGGLFLVLVGTVFAVVSGEWTWASTAGVGVLAAWSGWRRLGRGYDA